MSHRGQSGFSMVELLIVVAIILIIGAIAIPNYLQAKIRANEAAAVANVRTLVSAESLYNTMFPDVGYAPDVKSLAGDGSSSALPTSAGLISNDLVGSGHAYLLSINTTKQGTLNTGFTIYSKPSVSGITGKRGFCANETGVVTFSDDGSQNCLTPVPF